MKPDDSVYFPGVPGPVIGAFSPVMLVLAKVKLWPYRGKPSTNLRLSAPCSNQ